MKRYTVAALGTLLITTLLAGCGLVSAEKQAEPSVQPIPVSVTEARAGRLLATSLSSGQVEPLLSVTVTAKIPGRVVRVLRQMGDQVKAGDLLVELEDRDALAQVSQARANVAQAEAQQIEADRQLKRLQSLLEAGAVARQQVEQVQTQLSLAAAQVTAARAALDLALANLERTRVSAPADGVLAARMVEPGTLVGAGSSLFQLVDLSTAIVKAGVAEGDVNQVRPGTRVPINVPALGREFEGTVEAVSPNMDRQTRSFQVRIAVANPGGVLKGGMFAQVRFPSAEKEGILVPVASVLTRNGESIVFVADGPTARQRSVTVLVTAEDTVAVDGLNQGDKVVTAGQNRLYDGAPVAVGGSAP